MAGYGSKSAADVSAKPNNPRLSLLCLYDLDDFSTPHRDEPIHLNLQSEW